MPASSFSIEPIDDETAAEGLDILIPRFESGPFPPETHACVPLLPALNHARETPYYARQSVLHKSLIIDEVAFRRSAPAQWHERCWFILGYIQRDPHGRLWGDIRRFAPAQHIESSFSFFEFKPETWSSLRSQIERTGEMLLGWVHSHSLNYLKKFGQGDEAKLPAPQCIKRNRQICDDQVCNCLMHISSGLFLSQMDIESAMKRGFNAAYQLTCILDSDACLRVTGKIHLGEIFGVWGYVGNSLRQRSIHLIKD